MVQENRGRKKNRITQLNSSCLLHALSGRAEGRKKSASQLRHCLGIGIEGGGGGGGEREIEREEEEKKKVEWRMPSGFFLSLSASSGDSNFRATCCVVVGFCLIFTCLSVAFIL